MKSVRIHAFAVAYNYANCGINIFIPSRCQTWNVRKSNILIRFSKLWDCCLRNSLLIWLKNGVTQFCFNFISESVFLGQCDGAGHVSSFELRLALERARHRASQNAHSFAELISGCQGPSYAEDKLPSELIASWWCRHQWASALFPPFPDCAGNRSDLVAKDPSARPWFSDLGKKSHLQHKSKEVVFRRC